MPGTATPPSGVRGDVVCVTGVCGWPWGMAGRPTSSPFWNVLAAGPRIVSGGASTLVTAGSPSWASTLGCGNGGACWNIGGGNGEDAGTADADTEDADTSGRAAATVGMMIMRSKRDSLASSTGRRAAM